MHVYKQCRQLHSLGLSILHEGVSNVAAHTDQQHHSHPQQECCAWLLGFPCINIVEGGRPILLCWVLSAQMPVTEWVISRSCLCMQIIPCRGRPQHGCHLLAVCDNVTALKASKQYVVYLATATRCGCVNYALCVLSRIRAQRALLSTAGLSCDDVQLNAHAAQQTCVSHLDATCINVFSSLLITSTSCTTHCLRLCESDTSGVCRNTKVRDWQTRQLQI
jgi:hypothetical protein